MIDSGVISFTIAKNNSSRLAIVMGGLHTRISITGDNMGVGIATGTGTTTGAGTVTGVGAITGGNMGVGITTGAGGSTGTGAETETGVGAVTGGNLGVEITTGAGLGCGTGAGTVTGVGAFGTGDAMGDGGETGADIGLCMGDCATRKVIWSGNQFIFFAGVASCNSSVNTLTLIFILIKT
jgi:hypothetical protein